MKNKDKKTNESDSPDDEAASQKKKSLVRSWKSSGPVARLTLVFTGITALAGVVYIISYLYVSWSCIQSLRPEITIGDISTLRSFTIKGNKADMSQPAISGKPLAVHIDFKNVGKSIAVNEVTHRHILFGADINKMKVEPVDDVSKLTDIISPGVPHHTDAITVKDTYRNESTDLNPDDLLDWDGTYPVVVFGRFYYEDTSGTRYCLPYAYVRYGASGVWEEAGQWTDRSVDPPIKKSTNALCPIGKR